MTGDRQYMAGRGDLTGYEAKRGAVETEVADCLIILDQVTRGQVTAVDAVAAKVAADRIKHGVTS